MENRSLEELNSIIQDMHFIANKYSMNDLEKQANKKSTNIKYSIQSYCIHRGYYCPSPIEEIIVGGVKRGKLADKIRKTTKNYYKYRFDKNDHLLVSEEYTSDDFDFAPYEIEYIININDFEYGITYHNYWKDITHVSKSQFEDGLIKSYTEGIYEDNPNDMGIQHEDYFYDGNRILTRAIVYFNVVPKYNLCERNEFVFKRNSDGQIYEYDVTGEFEGEVYTQTFQVD